MFNPIYQISNKMVKSIGSIEGAREVIENSPLVPYWERQFREDTIIRTAHHTTALEGNPLSLDEARLILSDKSHEVKGRSAHIQEVINYREKWYGTRNSTTGEISFVAPPPEELESLISSFFEWLSSTDVNDLHPLIKAGIIIAEVARIHPYTEGNGRTARALGTASLYLDGYDIKRFFCLDEYYDQNSDGYYQAIQSYQKIDDPLTLWLEFFLEGLDIELSRVKNRVLKMSKDHRLKEEIGQVALSDREEEILKFIEEHRYIRNQDWRDLFPGISDDTILRDLKDMMDKGVIKKTGKTKGAQYELR
jgi:Fic family protein